jgi:hypothetical protein
MRLGKAMGSGAFRVHSGIDRTKLKILESF